MIFIDPIYNASNEVLINIMQLKTKKGKMQTKANPIITQDLNISIGVTGDLKGSIFFSLPQELALKIVEEMSGMPIDKIDKFATSAIAELANIISGNAATKLSEKNYNCDIAPPQIISGSKNQVTLATKEIFELPIKTKLGNITINISLTTK